jgi:hypothetical protein
VSRDYLALLKELKAHGREPEIYENASPEPLTKLTKGLDQHAHDPFVSFVSDPSRCVSESSYLAVGSSISGRTLRDPLPKMTKGQNCAALDALRHARAAGIGVKVSAGRIDIEVPWGAPPEAIEELRRHEGDIIALLTPGANGMTGEEWIFLFEERAAALEHEGCLPQHEAEARAFEYTLVTWRDRVPAAQTMGICAHCGRRGEPGMQLVPYGTLETGTAVLHTSCWPAWNADRIRRGTDFLNSLGVTADTE